MAKFISRQKLSKKVESKKLYNRKRKSTERYGDYGSGLLFYLEGVCKTPSLFTVAILRIASEIPPKILEARKADAV